ncbi:putative naDH-cytochrome b5 reductase 1 [Cardiosporidium cionae]|uniref:NaDH-cytochrome b5 reductase 1 n=1 Tax=Cardiosporidium cionae TaxID=476202 RepID=A0ABQ7JA81_9APIC|nr:putative naDH-cytochrome b5 reductase 1 [Cardiosporidium cionae]|eukprot:KAF8820891.1 putative naDH-cytochrome b5 reductase 1 [Cardiosporidium cionae]
MEYLSSTNTFLLLSASAAVAVGFVAFFLLPRYNKKSKKFLDTSRKSLLLVAKTFVSHDTWKFRFSLGGNDVTLGLPIGQHIKFFCPNVKGKIQGEWNGKADNELQDAEIGRKYTPVTGNKFKGYVDFVIKVYSANQKPQFVDGGKMSQYFHRMEIGDKIDITGPVGRIEYKGEGKFVVSGKEYKKKKIGMLAGGTGITPMLQIIEAVLEDPSDETELSLLFANQTEEDILVRKDATKVIIFSSTLIAEFVFLKIELEEFQARFPERFKLWYTLDRSLPNWKYSTGYISTNMIESHIFPPSEDTLVLMCGPPAMIANACRPNLEKLGYKENDILKF